MAYTHGIRPDDVVTDKAGNVLSGVTYTVHASKADAVAGSPALGSVTTKDGQWEFASDLPQIWVRDNRGKVWPVSAAEAPTGGGGSVPTDGATPGTVLTANGAGGYSWQPVPAGAVQSVNGKTGSVSLTASDVGALTKSAADALYAAAGGGGAVSSVNSKTGAVSLSATDVGAIPAGDITRIVVMTQAAYDALSPKVSTTLYVIQG